MLRYFISLSLSASSFTLRSATSKSRSSYAFFSSTVLSSTFLSRPSSAACNAISFCLFSVMSFPIHNISEAFPSLSSITLFVQSTQDLLPSFFIFSFSLIVCSFGCWQIFLIKLTRLRPEDSRSGIMVPNTFLPMSSSFS